MPDLLTRLAGMSEEAMQGALMALDEISRPLTVREIEQAMIGKGVSRTQRKIIAKAVEGLHIVAVVGGEHG